jgi:hypothetical protein
LLIGVAASGVFLGRLFVGYREASCRTSHYFITMDIGQSARRLPPQRYSISRLLQIAAETKSSFDLSKFTYDAARGKYTVSIEPALTDT